MFYLSPIQQQQQQPKRNIPASKVAMKFFNWSKIANQNYQDTLWMNNTNEEHFYATLDLDEFQNTFSAYQQNYQENEPASLLNHTNSLVSLNTGYGESFDEHSLAYRMTNKSKKEFSVIDNRRATNLAILLAKFKKNKLTNEQLQSIILSMDQGDELAKDMVEQLLKFVPTAEEETLLNEHEGETMAEHPLNACWIACMLVGVIGCGLVAELPAPPTCQAPNPVRTTNPPGMGIMNCTPLTCWLQGVAVIASSSVIGIEVSKLRKSPAWLIQNVSGLFRLDA